MLLLSRAVGACCASGPGQALDSARQKGVRSLFLWSRVVGANCRSFYETRLTHFVQATDIIRYTTSTNRRARAPARAPAAVPVVLLGCSPLTHRTTVPKHLAPAPTRTHLTRTHPNPTTPHPPDPLQHPGQVLLVPPQLHTTHVAAVVHHHPAAAAAPAPAAPAAAATCSLHCHAAAARCCCCCCWCAHHLVPAPARSA